MYSTLFFYIPLPLLQGYDVKMTDFPFNRGRKNANEESFFLFLNLDMVQRKSIPGSRIISNIRDGDQKNANSLSKRRILCPVDLFCTLNFNSKTTKRN